MNSKALRGWRLVGWTTLVGGLLTAASYALAGGEREGLSAAMRWTARLSGSLFLLAFSASSLRQLRPGPLTDHLLSNRRYLGLSFGVAHAWHLSAVIAYLRRPDVELEPMGLVIGMIPVAFIAAMLATSFDTTAAWLGARRWKILHTTGGWLLWLVFLYTWAGAAPHHPLSGLMALLALAAVGVRAAAILRRRSQRLEA
jgi:DMSO/TMAO reductase YedYZ heme-binding membrane subunit